MPTGTLHVNTEVNIIKHGDGPNQCSLAFQWTSKARSLSALDEQLLQKIQPISSLPIYVDFLPALESRKPTPSGNGDQHVYFIVPKHCNVCYEEGEDRNWRESASVAEINAITNNMSDKHIRCYKIMKFITHFRWYNNLSNYHIKTIVLHHHTACSSTTDNCVDCVMAMFQDLLHAYETRKLLSYASNLNLLNHYSEDFLSKYNLNTSKSLCQRLISKIYSAPVTDTWEGFIRKMWTF